MKDKTNDEPRARVYKGTVMDANSKTLSTLVNKFIQRIGPAEMAEGYETYGKVPNFMFVKSTYKAHPRYNAKDPGEVNQCLIADPRDGWRERWVFLDSKKHKANLLTGRMGVTLTEELMEYQAKNLGKTINYPGGNIGCDPEIFVVDKTNQVIPAWEFLPSKKKPAISGAWHGKGLNNLYWDGFQAEYTTAPYACLGHESDCIQSGLYGIFQEARKKFPEAKLAIESVLPVNPQTLAEAAEEHVEFGCMPSKNVYGLAGELAIGRETPARFAGGHLHFGIAAHIMDPKKEKRVVKCLDQIIGVSSVALFAGYENPMRRKFYGLPGEYRTPPHGLEYRVLPNAWLIHPVIMNITFELSRKVIGYGLQPMDHWQSSEEETIDVIRNSDVDAAKAILKRNEGVFKGLFNWSVFAGYTDELYNLFYQGMGEFLEEPRDIVKNWGLDQPERNWLLHCEGPGMNWTKGKVLLREGKKLPKYVYDVAFRRY